MSQPFDNRDYDVQQIGQWKSQAAQWQDKYSAALVEIDRIRACALEYIENDGSNGHYEADKCFNAREKLFHAVRSSRDDFNMKKTTAAPEPSFNLPHLGKLTADQYARSLREKSPEVGASVILLTSTGSAESVKWTGCPTDAEFWIPFPILPSQTESEL